MEYDCESETRELVATSIRSITNFFGLYEDKVLPNQKNGIYGHGKERYDKMEAIFDYEEVYNSDVAWEALKPHHRSRQRRKLPVIPSGLLFMMIPISPQRLPSEKLG